MRVSVSRLSLLSRTSAASGSEGRLRAGAATAPSTCTETARRDGRRERCRQSRLLGEPDSSHVQEGVRAARAGVAAAAGGCCRRHGGQ